MEETLTYAVAWLRRDFKAFCQRELAKQGVSLGQLYFLLYIGKYQPCSAKALAQALLVDAGQTTRSVDKLVEAKLVQRQKSQADKRSVELSLTDLGWEAYTRSRQLFKQWDDLALGALDTKQAADFMAMVHQMVACRKEELASEEEGQ